MAWPKKTPLPAWMHKGVDNHYIGTHASMYGQIGRDAATFAAMFMRAKLFSPSFIHLPMIRLAPVAPYGKCMALSGNGSSLGHIPFLHLNDGIWLYLHEAFYGTGNSQKAAIAETVLHELLHWELRQRNQDPKHVGEPWARRCQEISTRLGLDVQIERPRSRRINGKVTKETPDGCLPYADLVRWPHGLFPVGGASLLDRCSSPLQATNGPEPIGGES